MGLNSPVVRLNKSSSHDFRNFYKCIPDQPQYVQYLAIIPGDSEQFMGKTAHTPNAFC